jgi:hypothetical protein
MYYIGNNINNKECYILNNNNFILYIELYKYYIMSNTSARKFKDSNYYLIELNNNELIKKKLFCLFNKYNLKISLYEKIIERKKNIFFKNSYYENKGKIKIVGRGWKIIKYSYQLVIKLGYSHLIFLLLSPFLKYKLKKKKKKYYIFYGVDNQELNTLLGKLKLMRIPDVYTKKGIFHRKINF